MRLLQRAMPGTLSNANVVAVLNTIDTSEIEAAQLAKQKASSQAVRTYAARLIDDHTDMMQKNPSWQPDQGAAGEAPIGLGHGEHASEDDEQLANNQDRISIEPIWRTR